MYRPIQLKDATTPLMKKQLIRLSARVSMLILLAVCSAIPLSAQQSSVSTSLGIRPPGLARSPGNLANVRSAAEIPSLPATTPHWSSDFRATIDTVLTLPSAVYDQTTNTMIVFGGLSATLADAGYDTNAVLLNAPATGSGVWSTLIANGTAGSPPARDSHSAVYDSVNNRMIIFGGEVYSSQTGLNDVWVLSNANGQGGTPTWTQLSPSGSLPTARELHSAVYDATNNLMTVFGGATSSGQPLSDVWVLSHANGLGGTPAWTRLLPTGGLPTGLYGHTAIYDSTNNIMTVFAGINSANTSATNGVYTLSHANGLGGTPLWTRLLGNGASGSPAKRESPTAVYDPANNRMIIFGGGPLSPNPDTTGAFNDVWVLSNANGIGGTPVWTKLRPSGGPPGTRFFHTAVYDAVNNLMVIFGGDNDEALYFVTWVLSDANGL